MTRNSKTLTDDDRAALATLTLAQALAVSKLVTREPDRITVRDCLLRCLRGLLPPGGTPHHDAHRMARELDEPGAGRHGAVLRTVAELSRCGRPPSADRIMRVLSAS